MLPSSLCNILKFVIYWEYLNILNNKKKDLIPSKSM